MATQADRAAEKVRDLMGETLTEAWDKITELPPLPKQDLYIESEYAIDRQDSIHSEYIAESLQKPELKETTSPLPYHDRKPERKVTPPTDTDGQYKVQETTKKTTATSTELEAKMKPEPIKAAGLAPPKTESEYVIDAMPRGTSVERDQGPSTPPGKRRVIKGTRRQAIKGTRRGGGPESTGEAAVFPTPSHDTKSEYLTSELSTTSVDSQYQLQEITEKPTSTPTELELKKSEYLTNDLRPSTAIYSREITKEPTLTPAELEPGMSEPAEALGLAPLETKSELETDYELVTQEITIMITPFSDVDPKDFNENQIRAVLNLKPDELRVNRMKLWAPRILN